MVMIDDRTGSDTRLTEAFNRIVTELRDQPPAVGVPLAQRWQDRLAGVEAELTARGGGPNRHTTRKGTFRHWRNSEEPEGFPVAGAGSTRSSREADRRARRADAVKVNPELGEALATGEMVAEQLDALADAAAKTDGAAATDQALIDQVTEANPDQARDMARRWVDDHTAASEREAIHRTHRRKRHVSRYQTSRGTWALRAEGDKTSVDEMYQQLDALADAAYRAAGGRSLPAGHHPRTEDQRRYDALHHQLVGSSGGSASPKAGRPRIHVGATVDDLFGPGTDPATLIGTGPLPAMVLERYWCNAELIGTIYGGDGQPLWQGRSVRTATDAQLDALIARDHGCVLCGASPSRCEAHHLIPFSAPARGRTDIDQLVLLCSSCHHLVHDNRLTVIPGETTTSWTTRPATPDELPARPPPRQRSP